MTASIGTEIDKLYRIEGELDAVDQELKKLEAKRKKVQAKYEAQEAKIFANFDKQALDGATGKTAEAHIDRKVYGTIKNPKLMYDFIFKEKRFDLLQRRLNTAVYRQLSLDGTKKVPGLLPFVKTTLKLKGRVKREASK